MELSNTSLKDVEKDIDGILLQYKKRNYKL